MSEHSVRESVGMGSVDNEIRPPDMDGVQVQDGCCFGIHEREIRVAARRAVIR